MVNCLGRKINTFLEFTDDGSTFTFGYLVSRTPFIPGLLSNESVAYNVTSEVNEAMAVPGIVVFKVRQDTGITHPLKLRC